MKQPFWKLKHDFLCMKIIGMIHDARPSSQIYNEIRSLMDFTNLENIRKYDIMEKRYNDGSHYTKDEHGRFTGSTSSGGGSSSGGKGSGSGNIHSNSSTTNESVQVGIIDFNDKQAINKALSDAEEEFADLDYEKCCTVTSDGKVWITSGTSAAVDNSDIEKVHGSSLKGSYSYHNHPPNETYYSFSGADAGEFISKGEQFAKASDYKYEYTMSRRNDTVSADTWSVRNDFSQTYTTFAYDKSYNDSTFDIDEHGYDLTMKILARKYNFDYERKLKL